MRSIRRYLITVASLLCLAILAPAAAYASPAQDPTGAQPTQQTKTSSTWNPYGSVSCAGDANSSAVCQDQSTKTDAKSNPIAGPNGIIMKVVNVVAFIAGVAAVIIIILASLRMVTSGGSSDDVAGARRSLIYALVGIVVIVLARTLIAFVLVKL